MNLIIESYNKFHLNKTNTSTNTNTNTSHQLQLEMAQNSLSNAHLHCIFVYCDEHDQGAVAIITHIEWLDIINTTSANNYEKIFKYIITMCGSNQPPCKQSWRCCGKLEYNPHDYLLIGNENVQTNFDKECGGWDFKYFKHNLYTSKENIECHILPRIVNEYLSHQDM